MFEKEAEEIMRQNGCRTHSGNFIKADKVCELIQKGAEFGYNKANEWHYVKDGDLPKDSRAKLCYTRTAKYVCASYDEEYDCWGFVFNNLGSGIFEMTCYTFKIKTNSDNEKDIEIVKNKLRYIANANREYEKKDGEFYFGIKKVIPKADL